MKFSEIVKQAVALLQDSGRVSHRALKREFDLDDETLEDLKEELIEARRVAVDENGRVLIWNGQTERTSEGQSDSPASQSPASYTPPHLAERILAEQAAMEKRGATDGERKTITALFADLKGSTALIEGLDPEDARAIIDLTTIVTNRLVGPPFLPGKKTQHGFQHSARVIELLRLRLHSRCSRVGLRLGAAPLIVQRSQQALATDGAPGKPRWHGTSGTQRCVAEGPDCTPG